MQAIVMFSRIHWISTRSVEVYSIFHFPDMLAKILAKLENEHFRGIIVKI